MAANWNATFINGSDMQTSIGMWLMSGADDAAMIWLCALLQPGTLATFSWQQVYEFVWGDTGPLFSGKVFYPAQRLATDGATSGALLQRDADNNYQLVPYSANSPHGTFTIVTSDIPAGTLTVGINMQIQSGMGQPGSAFAIAQAYPNYNYAFTVPTQYRAGYGDFVQGEFSPSAAAIKASIDVDFGSSTSATLLLDQAGTFRQITEAQAAEMLDAFRPKPDHQPAEEARPELTF